MSNHHCLKILPEHFNNVNAGTKTFEIRKNDRAFQKGDKVTLMLFDGEKLLGYMVDNKWNENVLHFEIGDVYPIDNERVVFSLLKTKDNK